MMRATVGSTLWVCALAIAFAGLGCSSGSAVSSPDGGGSGGGGGTASAAAGAGGRIAGSGGGSGATAGSGASAGTGGPSGGGGAAAGGDSGAGPIILSLSTNVSALTPDTTTPLIVTAVVTHPGGIAQLIGGTLSDPPMGGTYGAFQVSTTAGSYSLSLSWQQIEAVRAVDDAPPSGVGRLFRAQFFDQAGHSTSQDVTVNFWCGGVDALCGGACANLASDIYHCGTCDNGCYALGTGGSPMCVMGKCVNVSMGSTTPQSCDSLCATKNLTCTAASVAYQLTSCSGVTIPCSEVPPATSTTCTNVPFRSVSCTCTQ
jgi:hypothetical protein